MRKWCVGIGLVLVVGVCICFPLFEADWRYPKGPDGHVQVHYTIPVRMEDGQAGANEFRFQIAGDVERVQLVPTSGDNGYYKDGFVMLYIKTSEGWYKTPTASLGGPIDWKEGVDVQFIYPEGMALRKQTRSPVHGFYPAFGPFRWRSSPFGFGNHLDEGDIASVHFCNAADGTQVTVHRTNGLKHSGYHSWAHPGMAVEVTVFDK